MRSERFRQGCGCNRYLPQGRNEEHLASARPILNRPHFFRRHDVALGFSATNVDPGGDTSIQGAPTRSCARLLDPDLLSLSWLRLSLMGSESENAAKKLSMPFAQFVRLTYRLASRESSMNSAQSELLIPCVFSTAVATGIPSGNCRIYCSYSCGRPSSNSKKHFSHVMNACPRPLDMPQLSPREAKWWVEEFFVRE